MNTHVRVLLVTGVVALAPGCSRPPADPGLESLLGAWSGTAVHDGEEEPFALELEAADEGKVLLRLTVPAMGYSRLEAGVVEPQIEGRRITLGPFVFTLDAEADTLRGTLPSAMVPVYAIPLSLRRAEAVEPLPVEEASGPLAEPVWTFDAGAPSWPGPTWADGLVYAGDARRGGVMALGRASGEAVWRYSLEPPEEGAWGFPGSHAVGDGLVFVTGIGGRVLAFDQ